MSDQNKGVDFSSHLLIVLIKKGIMDNLVSDLIK